jgi:hypothetical protein
VQTLTEIVRDLDPLLREQLSAVRIEPRAVGFTATLSFCLCSSWRDPADVEEIETGQHVITADLRELPLGVGATVTERWPDMLVGLDPATHPETQIHELHASVLVGHLDAVRIDRADGATRAWVIKTQANSEKERAAWLRALARAR